MFKNGGGKKKQQWNNKTKYIYIDIYIELCSPENVLLHLVQSRVN